MREYKKFFAWIAGTLMLLGGVANAGPLTYNAVTFVIPELALHTDMDEPDEKEFTVFGHVFGGGGTSFATTLPSGEREDWNPFQIIAAKHYYISQGQISELADLFTPGSRAYAIAQMNDPEDGPLIQQMYSTISSIQVACQWLESPGRVIVYGYQSGLLRPFIMEFQDGKFYFVAGIEYESDLANAVENLFAVDASGTISVVSPPAPDDLDELLQQAGLVALQESIEAFGQ